MRRLAALLLGVLLSGCGGFLPPPDRVVHDDRRPLPAVPSTTDPSLADRILEMSFTYQLQQAADLPRVVRKIAGHPYEALNVDNFDRVPNSTWFTNRNGRERMSLEAIRRGPNHTGPPSPTGTWRVVALKSAGVTPGMTIVDERGERFIIKYDPPAYPELPSGTEAVASRLFYAAGYNVPETYITELELRRLHADPDAVVTVETNDKRQPLHERPMTDADLEELVRRVHPDVDAPVRVLASRFLPGVPAGPWGYLGVRQDDLNDVYPHEHRRELRGLYVIASWLNHADMKEENTLDMYDPEGRFLTHYLIDFGASMGSNSTNVSNPRRGQANSLDVKDSLTRLLTLGLYVHDYEKAERRIPYPSVGYLENDLFRPGDWKPMYPAPPFENLTKRDAFWGAQIVTSFTDEQIRVAVETGQFSDPEAAAHMVRFLIERRDRIGRYWFARVNPLDGFACDAEAVLTFRDLAVDRGYADGDDTRYRVQVLDAKGQLLQEGMVRETRVDLAAAWRDGLFVAVDLRPERQGLEVKPVRVYLEPVATGWDVVGLRRLD